MPEPIRRKTVILTRPMKDSRPLAEKLRSKGFDVITAPLLEIEFLAGNRIPDQQYQAVLFTSANGAEALACHSQRQMLAGAKAVTVGPASTRAAENAGYTEPLQADGDVSALIATVCRELNPASGRLLYISGEQTTGDLEGELTKAGFQVDRCILYRAVAATDLPNNIYEHLHGAAVMLFSPRTATIWCDLIERAQAQRRATSVAYLCLSRNVARVVRAELTGAPIQVAEKPNECAMIRLLTAVD